MKKKLLRRITSVLIVFCLLITLLPCTALASEILSEETITDEAAASSDDSDISFEETQEDSVSSYEPEISEPDSSEKTPDISEDKIDISEEPDEVEEFILQEDPDEDTIDPSFEETGIFACHVIDNNGTRVNAWYDDSSNIYYLFLTNACSVPDITLNITGVIIKTSSNGTLDKTKNTLKNGFSGSGAAVTLTDKDGFKYNVTVLQSGLPSLNITLSGTDLSTIHSGSKTVKYSGNSVVLTDEAGNLSLTQTDVQIKGRGNTSWRYSDKRPYQIKFNKKQSVLGMAKAKKWILLANAFDDTLIRNQVAFYMAESLGMPYVPDYKNVDLWIDGEYRGSYAIGEKVEIDGSRLNLTSSTGVIVEQDDAYYKETEHWFYHAGTDHHYALQEAADETMPGLAAEGMSQFSTKLTAFWNYISNTNPSSITLAALDRYVDVDSLAKWYIVNEYTSNCESYTTSCFWYLDGPGDVLHMGPVWDFDISLGNSIKLNSVTLTYGKNYHSLFVRLMNIPAFSDYVRFVYTTYSGSIQNMANYAASLGSTISASADMNYIRWKSLGKANLKPDENSKTFAPTYNQAVSQLTDWLTRRYSAFSSIIENNSDISVVTAQYTEYNGQLKVFATNTSGYSNISVAIWSAAGGQDDIVWYNAQRDAYGTAGLTAYPCLHKKDTGYYHVHVYGTINGRLQFIGAKTVLVSSIKAVEASAVKEEDNNSLYVSAKCAFGYTEVRAAVWGEANGQNDLKWYSMKRTGEGSYYLTCDLLSHNETGKYFIDLYGYYNGRLYYLAGKTITADRLLKPTAAAALSGDGHSVKLKLTNSPGYDSVSFAVWGDKNAQNDLKWYAGSKDSRGIWNYTAYLADHNETGTYHVHIYGRKGSANTFITAVYFDVESLYRHNIKAMLSGSGKTLRTDIDVSDSFGAVKAAIWSKNGGQNDLRWIDAKKNSDNTWTVLESISAHKDTGIYYIDIYGVQNGKLRIMSGTTIHVDYFESPSVNALIYPKSMNIRLDNAEDCSDILFVVWTAENGQDDLRWYAGKKAADGTWRSDVNTRLHGGNGTYFIHVYGTVSGSRYLLTDTAVTVDSYQDPVICPDRTAESNVLNIQIEDNFGYDSISLAVWGEAGGQNDLVWYSPGKNADGTYGIKCNLGNHGETGKYFIDVYGRYDKKLIFACGTTYTLDAFAAPVMLLSETDSGFTISLQNAEYYTNVRFPVWTEAAWQDDIRWYAASKDGSGVWTCSVQSKNHGGNGLYYADAYGTLNKNSVFIDGGTINI